MPGWSPNGEAAYISDCGNFSAFGSHESRGWSRYYRRASVCGVRTGRAGPGLSPL